MDISNHSSTTSTWDISMGNQNLHDQLPCDFVYSIEENPLQIHHTPSSSSGHVFNSGIQAHQIPSLSPSCPIESKEEEQEEDGLGSMKEMIYKIAVMQSVDIDPSTIQKPKRRNVRISDNPQSVAARHRRERISERIRILQRLVPGGTKMDTASMLDEAIHYMKFLKRQVQELQTHQHSTPTEVVRPFESGDLGSSSSMGPPQGMDLVTGYYKQ